MPSRFALTLYEVSTWIIPLVVSDSHLVRGLIAISVSLFSDRAPKQILAVDALGAFRALGLEQHLTPQRSVV